MPDVDAISMINLAVVQSIVTLHAGGGVHFRTDPSTSIRKVFEAFRDALLAYDKDHGFVIDPVSAVKLARYVFSDDIYIIIVLRKGEFWVPGRKSMNFWKT